MKEGESRHLANKALANFVSQKPAGTAQPTGRDAGGGWAVAEGQGEGAFIWCPVKSVVYLLIWQWPKTECALGGNQKRHKAGLHTGFQRRRTSRFFWCFYTLISTTLSLNCTVLGLKQRNPDSKSQSWGPGNNSHTRRTFVWWRKSTACWGSHCPRKAGTGSPKGLGPAVAAAMWQEPQGDLP